MPFPAALTAAILLGLVLCVPARSQEISGTYQGTHEAGGPLMLVVSDQPLRVVTFEIEGVAGGGCSWDTITLDNWGGEVAVADGRFEATNPDGDRLAGAWVVTPATDRTVEGTIQVRDPVKGCETPPLRWVATVAAP